MKKRQLSFWEIWNMSFGFLGIQFAFALQNANTSRIFEKLGAAIDDIPALWLAAPVTGLIMQPIIGYYSDRTWTKLGRRRPYFLVGAILTTIALFLMPNSPVLLFAAVMLWIMDASINITMEPFRAFVADRLPDDQRTKGFAMQSFFIGLGAVVGSVLPWVLHNWFGIENTAPEGMIQPSVKWSYYIGGVVILFAVLWTVFTSNEYSPDEVAGFEKPEIEASFAEVKHQKQFIIGVALIIIGFLFSFYLYKNPIDKYLYVLSGGLIFAGMMFIITSFLRKKGFKNAFTTIMTDMLSMPDTMKQLVWVQFFSWFALFAMWIYTTKSVTSHIYNTTDATSEIYNKGADWVDVLFAVYNGVAALVAFTLPVIAKKTNRKFTHFLALTLGGLGLISIFFITNPNFLILSMVGVGIAWASILSMPYAILSSSLPANKMGYFMGVFNFFIVLPQIVAASILAFIIREIFNNQPIYAMIIGGVSMIVAGIITFRVKDHNES